MSNKILSLLRTRHSGVDDVLKAVAANVRALRLARNISQKDLAQKVGLALPTYRRFENTGEIALHKLVQIAQFFETVDEFNHLFSVKEYTSIEDILNRKSIRKRASPHE